MGSQKHIAYEYEVHKAGLHRFQEKTPPKLLETLQTPLSGCLASNLCYPELAFRLGSVCLNLFSRTFFLPLDPLESDKDSQDLYERASGWFRYQVFCDGTMAREGRPYLLYSSCKRILTKQAARS